MNSLREMAAGVVVRADAEAPAVPSNGVAKVVPAAAPRVETPAPAPVQRPVVESAPAIVGVRDDVDAVFASWERFVAVVRDIDEYASAVLRAVGLVAFGDGVMRVVAPHGSFAHRELSSSDLRARVEQVAREFTGNAVALELVEGEPSLATHPSCELVDRRRAEELRAAVEAEARTHPGILALVREFDGVIAQTRPLRER